MYLVLQLSRRRQLCEAMISYFGSRIPGEDLVNTGEDTLTLMGYLFKK